MVIRSERYIWNKGVSNSPKEKGVYALLDENRETIYIGRSENINERLSGYYNSNFREDPCKRATKYYQREVTNTPITRERELLAEYKKRTGKLPRCNDVVP